MRFIFFLFILSFIQLNAQVVDKSPFVQVEKGDFRLENKAYTFIGANYWYAAFVAVDEKGKNES